VEGDHQLELAEPSMLLGFSKHGFTYDHSQICINQHAVVY